MSIRLKRVDPFKLKGVTKKRQKKDVASNMDDVSGGEPLEEPKDRPLYELRRQRLTLPERKMLVKLAFDVLDTEHTGQIASQKLDDLALELKYLIRNFKTEEGRERERFMVTHGKDTLDEIEQEEKHAYQNSIDIESDSDHEQDESDLEGFIVSDTEVEFEPLQLTYIPEPKKRTKKKITLEDIPDPEV